MKHIALALLCAHAVACTSLRATDLRSAHPARAAAELEPVASEANWKERMEQPYVYLAHRGDYRAMDGVLARLFAETEARGLAPVGPPFALFYDDPGQVPIDELRARACLPLAELPSAAGALECDTLPRAMVVYACIPGASPSVKRAYPALFSYLGSLGWKQGGPVREVYLVRPAAKGTHEEFWTEIQIPLGRTQE